MGDAQLQPLGWQKPCYLLGEGYAKTYQELLDTTEWEKYGHKSGNPKCEDCMVHSASRPAPPKT